MTNKKYRQWALHTITALTGERLERIIGPRMYDEIVEVIEIKACEELQAKVDQLTYEHAKERSRRQEAELEIERLQTDCTKKI